MDFKERIETLIKLGDKLLSKTTISEEVYQSAFAENTWFDKVSIDLAVKGIAQNYLNKDKLEKWLTSYNINDIKPQKIGLILAGNIPFVGFHDILSCYISGHLAKVKVSSKDKVLIKFLLHELAKIDSRSEKYFEVVERLSGFDAVIATGSDESKRYFEKYFDAVPHILRGHRNAVAIVTKDTDLADITLLGHDIFDHYGLGCRNVSKLYLENGVELSSLFESWQGFSSVANNNKYKNNYDYNHALYLLNQEEFFTNNFIILRPNESLHSRIAAVHYEYYDNEEQLTQKLTQNSLAIQCVVASDKYPDMRCVGYGEAQAPQLDDYSDGVDTLAFLSGLR